MVIITPVDVEACGGINVIISDDPSRIAVEKVKTKDGILYYGPQGELIIDRKAVKVSPGKALSILDRFVSLNIPTLKGKFRFRKLEYVHGRIVYQFQSTERLKGYRGKYHLGPVNFFVERPVIDIDAKTGEVLLANGCGAAPGQLLARYDINSIPEKDTDNVVLISDNTNFIARKTGNKVVIDGRIDSDEWKNTGHRYFYIGEYIPHQPSEPHKKPFYHVEVWSQIDDKNIYFAVRTDTPYWIGLMFKEDPNLGMLWAYQDAKVLKSNGEITDRHFVQRKDKSFFLKKDKVDNILAAAVRQDDLYTYEFAFPLKAKDKEDITFKEGRAYNMLVLVGNTLEHYGIFTLDDSHKNHDHSKNNKEHADVWASNETIIRIGYPPGYDIFGRNVQQTMKNFVSGYDPKLNDTHFHYAAHTVKDISNRTLLATYINFATVLFGIIGMVFLFIRTNEKGDINLLTRGEKDLFQYSFIKRFFTSSYYRLIFSIPVLFIFIAIIMAGIFDVQDGRRNIATVYTWTLWWTLIIFSFILLGRLWCMMCPFAFLGDLAQKVVSLNKRLPGFLRNMGLQIVGFVVLTFVYAQFSLYQRPFATSMLILGILAAAVLSSMVFRKRTFCRYICPIGAVIGIYSMISPFKITPEKNTRCTNHKKKTCSMDCPMLENPYNLDSNIYCNYCMKCIPSCPSANLSLKYRGFGRDLLEGVKRSKVEAMASLFLFGIVLYETLAMTSALSVLKKATAAILGVQKDLLVSTIIYTSIISLPAIIFILFCYGLSKWLGNKGICTWTLVKEYAFSFIPLGIGLHLAHNLNHLFVEAPVAVPATIRLFSRAGLMSSSMINWNPLPLLSGAGIFVLQMITVVVGFLFTVLLVERATKRLKVDVSGLLKTVTVMTLYALISVSITFYMIGLPMSGRHVH